MEPLYRTGTAAKKLGISGMTLLRWIKSGKLKAFRVGREFRVPASEIARMLGIKPEQLRAAIYARASSQDQKSDLESQLDALRKYCAARGYTLLGEFSDIASGLNQSRRGLNKLIQLIRNHHIDTILISSKDRLTRFGFSYLESWFSDHGVRIEAISESEPKNAARELVEDLIAIISWFAGKLYGMRSHRKKRLVELVSHELGAGEAHCQL